MIQANVLIDFLPQYAGIVKRCNVCKHHISIDTGFKQTERAIFLHVISLG